MAPGNLPPKLRTSYKNARTIAPLYTSGPVAVSRDGTKLFTTVTEDVLMTDLATGIEICRFQGDTEPITSFAVSPSCTHIIVFTSSLSLRVYDVPTSTQKHSRPVQPSRVVARAHDAPVHVCKVDPSSTYAASGAADGVVKVWDIMRGYVTHIFKGHGGVVSALTFNYPQDPGSVTQNLKMQLITASVDTRIRIFDLNATANKISGVAKPEAVLQGHLSVPRGLDVSQDGRWLVSGGRDSVVLVWDLASDESGNKSKGKKKAWSPVIAKTLPILERVEAVGFLRSDEDLAGSSSANNKLRIYTGGQKGVIKIWDAREGQVLATLGHQRDVVSSEEQEEQRQIVDSIYLPSTSALVSIHADQNILIYSLANLSLTRQLVGFNDEIVDAVFLSPSSSSDPSKRDFNSQIAFATNSSLIRVYSTSGLDARLLSGHTDIVLSLDRSARGQLLASGGKDRVARIWAPVKAKTTEWGWGCVAVCTGHAESIGALAMSRTGLHTSEDTHSGFMFTGSQDRTIKMWDLNEVPLFSDTKDDDEEDEDAMTKCKSLTTLKAHEKDINSLDVSPDDRLLASGSQDRTAKIFRIEYSGPSGSRSAHGELKLLGTCKGHKRGVWCVRFGRAERVLATGSGDKTVKLWNIDDFTCVKTFEGHTNSVLRVDFLNSGMQMVTSASDGLVKLWNVREEECMATMDNHEDKVWALAVSSDERTIVSGAADSMITFWEDCTEEEAEEKETNRSDTVQKEQDFMNYLALNDYRRAIQLALAMEQPGRLYKLFKDIRSHADLSSSMSITGSEAVDQVVKTLVGSDLAKLLRYIRDWNAKGKTSEVAQGVLYAIMKMRTAEEITKAFDEEEAQKNLTTTTFDRDLLQDASQISAKKGTGRTGLKELLDAMIPYTERHLSRMEKLMQESYMVDYVLNEMDNGMLDGEDAMEVEEL